MGNIIGSFILAALISLGVTAIVIGIDNTEHQNVYYNTGKIVAVGQCKNSECSYQYTDNTGQLQFATSREPVSLGQLVYQECWYEKAKGNQCYVEYQPSKN